MKKINTLLLPLILFTTLIQANDKIYSFIGVQTSAVKFKDVSTPNIGVRYGQQSDQVRTSIAYNYGQNSDDSYHTLIMEIDTGILSSTFAHTPFKPYVGVSVGVIQHKNDTKLSYNDNGYLYGVNTGLTYIVNDAFDLDLGYKFMKTSKLKDLDKINDLTFAMHYFY